MKFDLPFTDKLILLACVLAYVGVLTIGYVAERPELPVPVSCSTDLECQDLNPTIEPY